MRIELDQRVEAEIARAPLLGPVPVDDGARRERDERTQQPRAAFTPIRSAMVAARRPIRVIASGSRSQASRALPGSQ